MLEELAVLIEDLNARGLLFLLIRNEDAPFGIDRDGMRGLELALSGSLAAPEFDELPVFRKLHDAVVAALTVGHKEITVGSECNIGRAVEQIRGIGFAGNTFLAQHHQLFAFRAELENLVIGAVGDPQIPVAIDIDAVGFFEHAASPCLQQLAVAIELQHGRLGRSKEINLSFAVGGNRTGQVPDRLSGRKGSE